MHKKRTLVIFCLLGIVVLVCVLQRTSIFSTVHAPSLNESAFTADEEMSEIATSTEEVPEPVKEPTTPNTNPTPKPLPVAEAPAKRCYVSGCSSQLCTSEPDMMSTCEYREEYACYQTATCEVQITGECGWTETEELKSCRMNVGVQSDVSLELSS